MLNKISHQNPIKSFFIYSILILTLLINCCTSVRSQTKAIKLYEEGFKLQQENAFKEAIEVYKKAIPSFKNNPSYLAQSYSKIGQCYEEIKQPRIALTSYEEALKIVEINALKKDTVIAFVYKRIGSIYHYRNDYSEARNNYQYSLAIYLESNPIDNKAIADIYRRLGMVYRGMEEFEKALDYLNNAILEIEKNTPIDSLTMAKVYHSMGITYFLKGDFDIAFTTLRKTLNIRKQVLGLHEEVGITYGSIGDVFAYYGQFDSSLVYYQKGLEIETKLFDLNDNNDLRNLAISYLNISASLDTLERHHEAIIQAQKSLNLQLRRTDFKDITRPLYNLGISHRRLGNIDSALFYIQASLIAVSLDFKDKSLMKNPVVEQFKIAPLSIRILKEKALLMAKRYKTTQDIDDLEAALEAYKLCIDLISHIRSYYTKDIEKRTLTEKYSYIYDNAFEIAFQLYKLKNDQLLLNDLFKINESKKAKILLETLQQTETLNANLPISLQKERQEIQKKLVKLEQDLSFEMDKSKVAIINKERIETTIQYDQLIAKQKTNLPNSYQPDDLKNISSLKKIQAQIPKNTLILNYKITNSTINIFVTNADTTIIKVIPKPANFQQDIFEYLDKLLSPNTASKFWERSLIVYNHLINPIEEYLKNAKKLIIISDGILYKMPFSSLISKMPKNESSAAKLYLIANYEISQHYSVTWWLESSKVQSPSWTYDFLGIAPDFSSNNSEKGNKFLPLIYSKKGITSIDSLFKEGGKSSKIFINDKATETSFKEWKQSSKIIHLATHSETNSIPTKSFIAFGNTENTTDDNILYLPEINTLNINADLIVLASCKSGYGKLEQGEGMISLARSFLYLGTSNTIYSLWVIDDLATNKLMVHFYANILEGKSYSQALQSAQIALINDNGKYNNPFYWAGLVLLGK